MAKNKNKAFVDAVRAKGNPRYFDLGGGVDLSQGAKQLLPAVPAAPLAKPPGANSTWDFFNNAGATPAQLGVKQPINPVGPPPAPGLVGNSYQAQLAPTTNLNYTPAVNAGFNAGQGNLMNQQSLESQFLAEGQGKGPNPAQAALNQATGANVANQAALMAGQRGASSNVGLMERNIAQQGAATQQQAVGQGATLQAQQQLAAQQEAAAQQAQIANQSNQLFGLGAQANNAQNAGNVANYGQAQGTNAAISTANTQAGSQLGGGILGALGSIGSALLPALFADGGEVPKKPEPPIPTPTPTMTPPDMGVDPQKAKDVSEGFKSATGYAYGGPVSLAGQFLSGNPPVQPATKMSKGGKVPVMLSPKEKVLSPKEAQDVAKGGSVQAKGKTVPGEAKVKGDSLKNDTVPDTLEPGSVVIPRRVMQGKDPVNGATKFVQAIMAKKKHSKGK